MGRGPIVEQQITMPGRRQPAGMVDGGPGRQGQAQARQRIAGRAGHQTARWSGRVPDLARLVSRRGSPPWLAAARSVSS